MAGKRITLMDLKQVFRLRQEGKSIRYISAFLGLHRRTVKNYILQAEATGLSYTLMLRSSLLISQFMDFNQGGFLRG